jgi:hypothetical protein
MCNIHRNEWRITRGMQPERRVLHLESRCYNESHPGPKLTTSLSRFLVCFKSLLDLVLAFGSLPNKCTPWFVYTIETYRCGFVGAFLQPFCSNGALVLAKSI